MIFKTIDEKLRYEQALDNETKKMSKKEKKAFVKCLNHENSKNSTGDRLRAKLEAKLKNDW